MDKYIIAIVLVIVIFIIWYNLPEQFHAHRLIYPMSSYEYARGYSCGSCGQCDQCRHNGTFAGFWKNPRPHSHLHHYELGVHQDDRFQRMVYEGELKRQVGNVHGSDYQPSFLGKSSAKIGCHHNRYHGVCEKGGIDTLFSGYPGTRLWNV
jgi:hypothetical protein